MKKIVGICLAIVMLFVWIGYSESASTISISKSVSSDDLREIREIVTGKIYESMKEKDSNIEESVKLITTDVKSFKKKLRIVRINKEDNIYYITGRIIDVKVLVLSNIESSDKKFKLNKGDIIKIVIFFKFLVKENGFGEKIFVSEEHISIFEYLLKFSEVRSALKQKKFM